jgi:hypothetical protein
VLQYPQGIKGFIEGGIFLFLVILVNLYLYAIYITILNDFQRFYACVFDQACGHPYVNMVTGEGIENG